MWNSPHYEPGIDSPQQEEAMKSSIRKVITVSYDAVWSYLDAGWRVLSYGADGVVLTFGGA